MTTPTCDLERNARPKCEGASECKRKNQSQLTCWSLGSGFTIASSREIGTGWGSLLTPDATWQLPGNNLISGSGPVVDRAQAISSYGVSFTLEEIVVSAENVALILHNVAERDGRHLDEQVADV